MQATLLPPRNTVLCAPITAGRDLGSCLIANIPMADLISAELTRAGFQMVDHREATNRTIRIPIERWLELGALLLLGRNIKSARLRNSDGDILAWKGAEDPEQCEEEIHTDADCFPVVYPWDLLRMNEEVVALMDESSMAGQVSRMASISGHVRLGARSRILPGTVIEGPVVIGQDCVIGPNVFIHGATSIGSNCRIGNGSGILNSAIYPDTEISSHCHIEDSIVGSGAYVGSGTRIEVLCPKAGKGNIISKVRGKEVDTFRKRLGVFIGDGARTGVNCSMSSGVKIGLGRVIPAGTFISDDLL
jgi:UDP-N-acetylglucosamine diphosphorylase / glucose-1-phosphate thymidylyltransferase / UDP-N-acetylgalactosamine diphosphorylase / glucosamine-1-phosphate N-acetyltransferase / galactosamine-1-phosphate N-acetyltransferase